MKLFTNAESESCLCKMRTGPCHVLPIGEHKYICLHTMRQHDLKQFLISDDESKLAPDKSEI